MKLNINIDETEMVSEIQSTIDAIAKAYLPLLFLGAGLFIVVLILTSFCGSALAIYCCRDCRFKRVRRKLRHTFRQPRKSHFRTTEDEKHEKEYL